MIFHETGLAGAYVVEPELKTDARGFFARFYCQEAFRARGLEPLVVQGNISYTARAGTLRGMHYQVLPAGEAKYIRVLKGAIYDVIIDLRPDSPTYLQHFGVRLTADDRRAIYVPSLFAHGHQALTDDVEISYLVSEYYTPGVERGIRFDDPTFQLQWPRAVSLVSEKDLSWPPFDAARAAAECGGRSVSC
jgi:dTDP-4-dehydrorhamnose 3,5-epimerase